MRVGGRLVGGPGGFGGDQVSHVGVHIGHGLVVVVSVVRRHLLDTGGDAPYHLDVRLRGRPAPLPLPCAPPFPPPPRALSCLPPGALFTLPLLAPGPPPGPQSLVRVHSLPPALWPVSRDPTSVTRALACSTDARVLRVPLLVSLVVSPPAARALARPVCPYSSAAASLRVLPVSLPSLLAACALVCPLSPSPGVQQRQQQES